MTRPRYIASCSGGKDSVATILLAAEKNEPLDEVIYSEVMFDQDQWRSPGASGLYPPKAQTVR